MRGTACARRPAADITAKPVGRLYGDCCGMYSVNKLLSFFTAYIRLEHQNAY